MLNIVGRFAYRPILAPLLTAGQRAVRLAWSRAHLGWSNEGILGVHLKLTVQQWLQRRFW
jgi:hypothetical protein